MQTNKKQFHQFVELCRAVAFSNTYSVGVQLTAPSLITLLRRPRGKPKLLFLLFFLSNAMAYHFSVSIWIIVFLVVSCLSEINLFYGVWDKNVGQKMIIFLYQFDKMWNYFNPFRSELIFRFHFWSFTVFSNICHHKNNACYIKSLFIEGIASFKTIPNLIQ